MLLPGDRRPGMLRGDAGSLLALLTRLATLLRAATDASHRPEQPLADELALLRAYADIMTQRSPTASRLPGRSTPMPGAAAFRPSAFSRCWKIAFDMSSNAGASERT